MHKGTNIRLVTRESKIIYTDHEAKELGLWITKHAPPQYKLKFLPFDLFLEVMDSLKILIICP
jgi:hypothetical protein